MGLAVVTVAAGGLPVIDVTAIAPRTGLPVTEASNGYGVAVTKVVGKPGMPVVFETIGVVAPVTYAAMDVPLATSVTLSGNNLIVTNTGTTSFDQGARVANAACKSTGKRYFEITLTTLLAGGSGKGVGVVDVGTSYTNFGSSALHGAGMYTGSGNIWTNGGNSSVSLGARSTGNVIGIAADFDNGKIWFRVAPAGNWNNNVANDPATNVGGIACVTPTYTMGPICTFGGTGGTAGNVFTFNLGASAFVGAVPAGFTSGWPA